MEIDPAASPDTLESLNVMFHLVYASTAAKMFSGSELLEMLTLYREKNVRLGITGLLLYKHGSFMQLLEGEEDAVRSLYDKIRADPKHHHVLTLLSMPVAGRQFPHWSMGFKDLGDMAARAVPGYNPHPALPPASDALSWQASVAVSLLAMFEQEN